MRSQRKYIAAPICDWCKQQNTHFVITASHRTFCRDDKKDCHTEYLNQLKELNYVRQKEEQKRLQEQEKKRLQIKKEKEIAKPKLNKKLEEVYDRLGVKQSERNYL